MNQSKNIIDEMDEKVRGSGKLLCSCPRYIMQISRSALCTRVTWPINSRNTLNTLRPCHDNCQPVERRGVRFQRGTYHGTGLCDIAVVTYNITVLDVNRSTPSAVQNLEQSRQ